MAKTLLCSDLHLTNRPLDEYRFGLFSWINNNAKAWGIESVTILGDLTDSKDRHDSIFVNKVVDHLQSIRLPVFILMGNHDYIDPKVPFFKFLNEIDGLTYYYEPAVDDYHDGALFLPHARGGYPALKDWNAPVMFCHQTFTGAAASNGSKMDGLSTDIFDGCDGVIYSGDIHVPQNIGPVTYVGAPYRITFGDKYKPRCLLLDYATHTHKAVHYPCISKHTLTVRAPQQILDNKHIAPGDQLKVRIKLLKSEYAQWPDLRRRAQDICDDAGYILSNVELLAAEEPVRTEREQSFKTKSVREVFDKFCTAENISDDYVSVGRSLMGDTRNDRAG
jgi:UDP-2,3-diacylglucosamine pyrophosphatase LpxH